MAWIQGIEFLVETGFIASNAPQDIALFLLNTDGLSKSTIGEYLGEGCVVSFSALSTLFNDHTEVKKISQLCIHLSISWTSESSPLWMLYGYSCNRSVCLVKLKRSIVSCLNSRNATWQEILKLHLPVPVRQSLLLLIDLTHKMYKRMRLRPRLLSDHAQHGRI